MLFAVLFAVLHLLGTANGHGRLIEPPSRASMWRYGFDTPADYNDHELYCGGFSRQWNLNGGKCGICGDPWDAKTPRAHEAGGKYGNGVIVRTYKKNSAISVKVELTANHRGYFEFRICPTNNPKHTPPQECLDKYVLQRADGKGPRYFPGEGNQIFGEKYRLPSELTCTQCVFQWRYIAGNNWGMCSNGTGMVGCGAQEEFRACADVAITEEDGSADDTELDVGKPNENDVGDNEIPDDGYGIKDYQGSSSDLDGRNLFYVGFIIAACSLILTAFVFSFIFFYYYHGRDMLKNFIQRSTHKPDSNKSPSGLISVLAHQPPIPPLRLKKNSTSSMCDRYSPMMSATTISDPINVTINGVAITPSLNS